MSDHPDPDFLARRDAAKDRINEMDRELLRENPRRELFFESVYEQADGDPVGVPWADLVAKDKLVGWLSGNAIHSGCAIDVGCGLGDNAEALAAAGYETTAFDFSPRAIEWALKRFPETRVDYLVADMFDLPGEWAGKFDLVHECYTLQSIPPETLAKSIPAIAALVAPGGILLVYSRLVEDGTVTEGPPWPLQRAALAAFDQFGLEQVEVDEFDLVRPDKTIAHQFAVWRRPR